MKARTIVLILALVLAALACTAPGGSTATETPLVVTVMVTSDGASEGQPTIVTNTPEGLNCSVVQDVRVHTCAGATSASVVGVSPATSSFTPTKWDGSNWYYGQIPTTGGPAWGWVSRLNSDGSTLVSCTGDMSALPKAYEPCPTSIPPTATYTPEPPTDTPMPTATTAPTETTVPVGLCGNGVADPGEQCGEPGLSCNSGTILKVCKACKCVFPSIVSP